MVGPASSLSASLLSDVIACLEWAERALRERVPAGFTEAAAACAELLLRIEADTAKAPGHERLAAALWLKRGHLLEACGEVTDLVEALRGYDLAIALLVPDAAPEAVEVRAGAWLNRGNTLRRLASPASTPEAIRSYEHAIAELTTFAAEPRARGTIAAAWSNLGLARLAHGDAKAAAGAQARALALIADDAARGGVAALYHLYLGEARHAAGEPAAALEIFRDVLAALAPREASDATALETGLRARHAACRVLADQLEAEDEEVTDATHARLAEATALVGGGLGLLRALGAATAAATRNAGARLFEFGAWLYRCFGTGQLAPYLAEYALAAEFPERAGIARAAIAELRTELLGRGFEQLTGEAAEQVLAELAALRAVEQHLN